MMCSLGDHEHNNSLFLSLNMNIDLAHFNISKFSKSNIYFNFKIIPKYSAITFNKKIMHALCAESCMHVNSSVFYC